MAFKFRLIAVKNIQKSLSKIPLPWRERIIKAIDNLAYNPYRGEKLWREYIGKRKVRVWPYRIIYSIDDKNKIVYILDVGHRQGIYK